MTPYEATVSGAQPTIGLVVLRTVDRPRPDGAADRSPDDAPDASNRPLGQAPAEHGRRTPTSRLRLATAAAHRPAARLAGHDHPDRWSRAWSGSSGWAIPTDAGTPVFDEKHYVPQAWQMLRNGGVEDNPGYELVVHPPLGKQLIALGELAFGYDGVGWRAAAALAGTLTVLLVVRAGRRLTRSTMLGGVAGLLLICDGLSHVQSRMGMLDAFSALFVVAAFATLLCDRDEVRARMAVVVREGRIGDSRYGPRLGVRWWRLATGVLLGLGCGVKWAGVYWLAAFAVLLVFWDLTARRAAGVERPLRGTLVRDLGPALWALAVVPVLAYLSCWWAWFGSETAIDRHVVGNEIGTGGAVGVPARRAARALVLQRQGAGLPRRAHHRVQRGAPVGVQAVDLADGPAPDALPLRVRRGDHRLRRAQLRQRGDADRHPGAVVAGAAGARVRHLAGGDPGRLALRRGARRLRRGHRARGS